MTPTAGDSPSAQGSPSRRVVVYLLVGDLTAAAAYAIDALVSAAGHVVVIAREGALATGDWHRWSADAVHPIAAEVVAPIAYRRAVDDLLARSDAVDEVVLTGDVWFGPVADLSPILARMSGERVDHWSMLDPAVVPAHPEEGFPPPHESWVWTSVSRDFVLSPTWARFWAGRDHSEGALARAVSEDGARSANAFPSAHLGDAAAILAPDLLIEAGAPIVRRTAFGLYPPYLHQQAFLGRDVLRRMSETGYPADIALDSLARSVPPKALNTSAGLLEIIPAVPHADPARMPRIVVVAHVSDGDKAAALRDALSTLPPGWDLVVTTGDGRKASKLAEVFAVDPARGPASVDIRVTPGGRGRDMGDFFVACRDIVHSDRYDLLVKVHARPMRRKTANVRRYFRRYQLENLLASPDHVRAILQRFEVEATLGLVFPPMMHIGFATMGRAWAGLREHASTLSERLAMTVPLDVHSPLAPFGGMWIARPAALRRLAIGWQYRDYAKPGRRLYGDLARLQERMLVPAAAQDGYHTRTVLAAQHAAISHTALEFKVDELFSTTTGYPVDQIRLMHRAGRTGYGGLVGLTRMYLSLNHRFGAAVILPVLGLVERSYALVRRMLGDERFAKPRPREDDV